MVRRFLAIFIGSAFGLTGAISVGSAATTVGETLVVVREVTGLLEQNLRHLNLEDKVFYNEVIEAGTDSATEIRFQDDTTLTIGPNTRITLDSVVYDPDPSKTKFVISITSGVLRLATGQLENSSYKVHTPVATVGVRGTVLDVAVPGSDTSLFNSIMEEMNVGPVSGSAQGGTLVWTDEGQYYVEDCHATDVWALQFGIGKGDAGNSFVGAKELKAVLSDGNVLLLDTTSLGRATSFEDVLALAKERFERVPGITVTEGRDGLGRVIQINDAEYRNRDFVIPQSRIDGAGDGRLTPLRLSKSEGDQERPWQSPGTATLVLDLGDANCSGPIVGPTPAVAEQAIAAADQLIIDALAPAAGPEDGGDDTLLSDILRENPSQVSPD